MTTHAPGSSAYNKIEHVWSVLSRSLAGVTFVMNLPGEHPPCQQNLSEEETKRKESVIFDRALQQLNGYWSRILFDSFPISSSHLSCQSPEHYNDHNSLDTFVKVSMCFIRDSAELTDL